MCNRLKWPWLADVSSPPSPPLYPSVTFWLKLKCRHDGWTCCLLNNRLLCFSCWSSSSRPSPPALPRARKVSAHDYQPKCPHAFQWSVDTLQPESALPLVSCNTKPLLQFVRPCKVDDRKSLQTHYSFTMWLWVRWQCLCVGSQWGITPCCWACDSHRFVGASVQWRCDLTGNHSTLTHFSHGTLNTVNKLWIINK